MLAFSLRRMYLPRGARMLRRVTVGRPIVTMKTNSALRTVTKRALFDSWKASALATLNRRTATENLPVRGFGISA